MSLITLIGDAHGKMRRLKEIQSQWPRTIQLGDVGFGFVNVPSMSGGKHVFIRGNHDDPAGCAEHPNYLGDFGYLPSDDIFYVSGAYSIDWMMRREGVSWWRDEELSLTRLAEAVELYTDHRPRYVVSHDCPQKVNKLLLSELEGHYFEAKRDCINSRTCAALQVMLERHQPERWIFGHYHVTKSFKLGRTKFQCLAELETLLLDTEETKS